MIAFLYNTPGVVRIEGLTENEGTAAAGLDDRNIPASHVV